MLTLKVEVRKWKDAVYWMAAEVRMLMERAEVEGLELGAGTVRIDIEIITNCNHLSRNCIS